MRIFWLIILVLSPAILYGGALIIARFYRERCRRCHRRGLKTVGGYLWDGERGGGAVTFYLCEKCRARFKRSLDEWSEPTEEEWQKHVKN